MKRTGFRSFCRIAAAVLPVLLCLIAARSAVAQTAEGVRTAGSRLPYIIGGIAAIAVGLFICIGMAASRREVVVTPTGLPIPAPLIPLILGIGIGIALFSATPEDTFVQDGIRYKLSETEAAAWGFADGADIPDTLRLPGEVEGLPLTSVGNFSETRLKEVILPESVAKISFKAFMNCTNLASVTMPGVATVGEQAFSGCSSLRELVFSGTEEEGIPLAMIGKRAFEGCSSLTSVPLGNVREVQEGAFFGCSSLREASFTDRLKKLGSSCFSGCSSLRTVTLSLETVPSYAFRDCTSLVTANLGDAEFIEEAAFLGCRSLIHVSMPNVRRIFGRAFKDCPSLLVAGGYTAIEKIAGDAFSGSPDAVLYDNGGEISEKKAKRAGIRTSDAQWWECEYLPDGTLRLIGRHGKNPDNVLTVPAEYCGLPVSRLCFYVPPQGISYISYQEEEIVVKDGVRVIEENCFVNYGHLNRITLPESIEEIAEGAISRHGKRLSVRSSSPAVLELARHEGWTVIAPEA